MMFEISISYNDEREQLFKRLDDICLNIKEKKQAEKKLKNILKTISLTTIFTAITKVAVKGIEETIQNPETIQNLSDESWWKTFCDNIAAIAMVCRMIAKFFLNVLWILKNPMQALFILFSWLSSVGMWVVVFFVLFTMLVGLTVKSEEAKDKLRHKRSVAIFLYITTLIVTMLLKIYLNIFN